MAHPDPIPTMTMADAAVHPDWRRNGWRSGRSRAAQPLHCCGDDAVALGGASKRQLAPNPLGARLPSPSQPAPAASWNPQPGISSGRIIRMEKAERHQPAEVLRQSPSVIS